jgi:uncharacterized RDD family membrane protein YckC
MAAAPPADPIPSPALPAPHVRRRLAACVYEGILLFGVVMIGAYLYDTLTQHRHALEGRTGLQVFLFLLLGVYFVWFWTHGGQTIAMKTWHIRVVNGQGLPVGQGQAFMRYICAWLWFVPALVFAHVWGLSTAAAMFTVLGGGVLVYALLALIHPQKQFMHDVICGTRLIDTRPPTSTS